MENTRNIGERIRKIIGGDSLKDSAAKINVTVRALSNYLNGRIPKSAVRAAICKVYGIREDWLLTGEGSMYEVAKTYDVSDVLESQREIASLQRELLEVYKKNGDLRVENERQKARIAELERELVRALKGEEAENLASAG